MEIEFTGKYSDNSELQCIVFQAIVNGESVSCFIIYDALQDIDPSNRFEAPEQLYEDNQFVIHNVATRLIENGRVKNGKLHISATDMKTL